LFNSLMEQYHYLGYEQPVGEHVKYLVHARGQAIACLAWSSAPRHLANRDRFIGWNMETRKRNLHLLAYNTRFLILPWVQVPHLASHILGRMAKLVPQECKGPLRILCTGWRLSLTRLVSRERVIALLTGLLWDPRRAAGTMRLPSSAHGL
jgi:Domain of unknown function (DUF4338)